MVDTCGCRRGPPTGPTILMFGPIASSFNEASFAQVRKTATENEEFRWALDTIAEFPRIWQTLTTRIPSLKTTSALGQLEDLSDAFRTGRPLNTPFPLPNKLLIPLVVVSQLTQYATFSLSEAEGRHVDLLDTSRSNRETLGLCIGLLSAFAVSSAGDKEQFEKYAAVAVRLALLIGIAVDAQNEVFGPSKSLSVMWHSAGDGEKLQHIVESFSGTYVSVHYDENRATITTKASVITELQQQLRSAGFIGWEVGIYGRFHADVNIEKSKLLMEFVDAHVEFQFPDATSGLVFPTRSNGGGKLITEDSLHHHALQSILLEPPRWFQTVSAVRDNMIENRDSYIISFGSERVVPPSLLRSINSQVLYMADFDDTTPRFGAFLKSETRTFSDNDVAVVGMSINVAGAEALDEFWDLLVSAKSQHKEVPKERFSFQGAFRDNDPKRKWFGNFIENFDKFDHKFFKKSPRESSTIDPQQRLFLQCAYQAVEQSGYFHSSDLDNQVGCFVGVCSRDYDANVACHPPNAFTAIGNLQSFTAGRISHHFGWTGPGLTIDTACSSSAVAIHQACRAITTGECTAALAGGANLFTNPLWFQNLAAGSFLSTTGPCKPFDAKADGYCRGEGVAAVFLKKLSAAVADGDQILGVVAATGAQQNENITPIFVPNSPSLADLFRSVTKRARLRPSQISVVEAHGTGTAVGDPAEYDGLRQVLGGPVSKRDKELLFGSVKGLVGHTEATSGIVSMIKVILMIQKGMIPPQPSYTSLNPAIGATPADKMSIPTTLQTWDAEFRAALINNYGASGSNASMILTQSPFIGTRLIKDRQKIPADTKYPFWIAGLDGPSIRRYSKAFRRFLSKENHPATDFFLSNVSFNLARQSNRTLRKAVLFSVRSIGALDQKLGAIETGDPDMAPLDQPDSKPVVLCFGGQISTSVGLDRGLYDRVAVLRKHLDNVDSVVRLNGGGSIFPGIFETTPSNDIVELQTMLFAIQYACARSWIDSGIKPVAVVGHSFGELTALAVSQVLSLEDAARLIIQRATLVRDSWGSDRGAMMAVEADLNDIEKLLSESNRKVPEEKHATIACYNGPRCFTLAGSTAAIDTVAATVSSSLRSKRLNVTNSFHCALADHLMGALEKIGRSVTFRKPIIPVERASEFPTQEEHTARFVADHMRHPVYFNHAIQRIAQKYPSSIFLEAGSNSTITSMASRALGSPAGIHFQAINITNCDKAWNNLVDATMNLWKVGTTVQHWAHQAAQTKEYSPLLLPPYQFEQATHWLDYKVLPESTELSTANQREEKLPDSLLTFVGYQDSKKRTSKFRINTMILKYGKLVAGHVLVQTAAICPATVQLDLVIEAVRNLRPDLEAARMEPQIHVVENKSPICINPARAVWIGLEEEEARKSPSWTFQVFSTDLLQRAAKTLHTTGRIAFCSTEDLTLKLEFARLERLTGHSRCVELLQSGNVDEMLSNRNIYKIFSDVVDYDRCYRGLRKLVGCGNQSAGHVVQKYNPETWLDPHLSDNFCQVGGIFVNCMTNRSSSEIYIANGIEQWIRSPKLRPGDARPDNFHVLATHHPLEKKYLTDVFVFHPDTGELLEAILGINYTSIAKASMSKIITRLTSESAATAASSGPAKAALFEAAPAEIDPPNPVSKKVSKRQKAKKSPESDVSLKVKKLLADLSGLDLDEIKDDSQLAELGIDSLMGMEMAHEIEAVFKVTLPENELIEIVDMPSLIKCVQKAVGRDVAGEISKQSEDETSSNSNTRSYSISEASSGHPTGITTPAANDDKDSRLCTKLDINEGPLKILEMGAGTGGTTKWLVPLLASLNVPVEYTFTDLAPSFVAAARKRFKQYSFMKFRTHDIEQAPADELMGTQHIVIASNAVHATHSLGESGKNIRKTLRSDGFLMMLEMTGTMYWVDMVFGLFNGWWFFDDGRHHAVTNEFRWQKDLQAVGYGHVDWTDGVRPENRCEKLIIAMASGERCERLPISSSPPNKSLSADLEAREVVVNRYVHDLTDGFSVGLEDATGVYVPKTNPNGKTVLITGATGSLGSHLIARLAELTDITRIVCLNRRRGTDPEERQKKALIKKGIPLSDRAISKLSVFETDMSKPYLGLPIGDYQNIVDKVTHIVHNAWLMNAKYPLRNFEAQFQIMKNLLNLSREISIRRIPGTKVTFQFISSIAAVGHRPIWSGEPIVPEERMTIESVLPTGYGDAKYICELMLDKTLHKYPDRFRVIAVRPGQIAGSSTSGHWNVTEHLSFLIKSSQTLKALPDFDGLLSWTPVDQVAGTLVDLLFLPEDKTHYPIYHVENPVRQQWKEMTSILANALDIPREGIIPFEEWVQRVREHPRRVEGPAGENPAFLLIDFLDDNFFRMSCGGLLLDTGKAREHSKTLANTGPVDEQVTRKFIQSWKNMGFLS